MSSQGHGFVMENRVRIELGLEPRANGTDIHDIDELPGETISIKTTGSDLVCCGDPVRLWNYREDSRNHEMIVFKYVQKDDKTKRVTNTTILKIDQSFLDRLFGRATIDQIHELVNLIKSIPKGRKQTPEEKKKIKTIKNSIPTGIIRLNPKIDSKQQRRLQCSFYMKDLLKFERIGGTAWRNLTIDPVINSPRRTRNSRLESQSVPV